ncbi:ABC transporter substrate-binding protein [Gluconobacter thailandicus]|nr:ABC transporter substrate-binding protein [Gluconobacter thailandicus]
MLTGLLLFQCLPLNMHAHATTSGSSHGTSSSVEKFFSHIGQSVTSVFSTPEASAHAHKHSKARHVTKRRTVVKPAAPPAPGWGVPEGTVAANALVGSDSTIRLIEWDGQRPTLDVGVHAARADWATVLLDGSQLADACQKGWVRPLEGNTTCGIQGGQSTLALAWDRSRLPSAPSWKDFWDVARHPGRRGLRLGARTTLEIALLADGIDARDIYTALSTRAGVDRAFHKLDLLRPYVVWWKTPDDAARIMEQSSALMTSAPMTEISSVSAKVKAGPAASLFVAQPDVVLRTALYWAIPANTPNEVAKKTLERINTASPHLDDTPDSATDPNGTILPVNEAFWTKYGDQLEQRFQDWYGSNQP